MEKKIFKTDRKIKSKVKFAEIVGDVIVPDVKPDIVTLINISSACYVQKEEKSNGRLRLDGEIVSYISYISDNAETRSIETSFNMVEQIESECINENTKVDCKVYIDSEDIKLLNERKVQVRIMLKLVCDIYEEYNLEISDIENDEALKKYKIEKRESKLELKNKIACNENKATIKEKMNLGDNVEVVEIIKVSKFILGVENKISINKVLSKADFKLNVMFINENGTIGIKEETFPVMAFIDIPGVNENDLLNVDYKINNVSLRLDSEKRNVIEVDAEFEVRCECYQKEEISLIEDMYSLDKELAFLKKDVNVLECAKQYIDTSNIYEKIKVEDMTNVLDLDVNVKEIMNDGSGKLDLVIVYETNNKNIINVKKEEVSFKINLKENEFNIVDDLEFAIINKKCTSSGEYVDCEVLLEIRYPKFKEKTVSLLDQVEIKDKAIQDSAISMYFVKPGDSLWEIAKKFGVKKETIIEVNELENENDLVVGDKLFIIR